MVRSLAQFAGPEHPLRASTIPLLMKCRMTAALRFLAEGDDSGVAADTGTAVHAAVAQWHKSKDYAAAVRAMREGVAAYPLADFHDAELSFRPYTADPRNQAAEVVLSEHAVAFELPGEPPVHVQGRLDQVRKEADGTLRLWDLKTGAPEGWDMLHAYLYQLAAYCVGANVEPGGVIRTRGYRKRAKLPADPPGVFWHYTLTLADCRRLMAAVVQQAQAVRRGDLSATPGEHCRFCPAGGIDVCIPKLWSLTTCA